MTIDTLDYVKKLGAAGVPRPQAEAHAGAVRDVVDPQLATKADLDAAVTRLEAKIDRIEEKFDGKFRLLEWMLGFNLLFTGGVLVRLLLK